MKIETSFAVNLADMVASLASADNGKIVFSLETKNEVHFRAEKMAKEYALQNGFDSEKRYIFILRAGKSASQLLSMLEIPEGFS